MDFQSLTFHKCHAFCWWFIPQQMIFINITSHLTYVCIWPTPSETIGSPQYRSDLIETFIIQQSKINRSLNDCRYWQLLPHTVFFEFFAWNILILAINLKAFATKFSYPDRRYIVWAHAMRELFAYICEFEGIHVNQKNKLNTCYSL